MSFILDALRKSEHARQHQKGPALAEVPLVARKAGTNVWATAAVALLVVNLIAVGVLMLRKAQRGDATGAAPVSAPATKAATGNSAGAGTDATPGAAAAAISRAAMPSASGRPVDAGPTLATDPQLAVTQSLDARRAEPEAAGNPLAAELSDSGSGLDPAVAQRAAKVPDGPPAVSSTRPTKRGSVVYAPIPEAGDAPYSDAPYVPGPAAAATPQPASPGSAASSSLPLADELVARGTVPPIHLDLHVYSNVAQQRFIFVNSRKYKEGDTLQEGPVVEQITPDGAVLSMRGSRFKLPRD